MFAGIPLWVPFLFLALVYLGHRQRRTHRVQPKLLTLTAVGLFALSWQGVHSLAADAPLAWVAWGLGYALTAGLGADALAAGMRAEGDRVRIDGSWLPMGLILGVFSCKFALGTLAALHSPLLQAPGFTVAASEIGRAHV